MSAKVRVKYQITLVNATNLPAKVKGYLGHMTWKRGNRPENGGQTKSKVIGENCTLEANENFVIEGTLMKNLKKGTYEAKLMAVSVIAEKVKSKSDKVVGKAVVNLADFVANPTSAPRWIKLIGKAKKSSDKPPELQVIVVATVIESAKSPLGKGLSKKLNADKDDEESEMSMAGTGDSGSEADFLSVSESQTDFKKNPAGPPKDDEASSEVGSGEEKKKKSLTKKLSKSFGLGGKKEKDRETKEESSKESETASITPSIVTSTPDASSTSEKEHKEKKKDRDSEKPKKSKSRKEESAPTVTPEPISNTSVPEIFADEPKKEKESNKRHSSRGTVDGSDGGGKERKAEKRRSRMFVTAAADTSTHEPSGNPFESPRANPKTEPSPRGLKTDSPRGQSKIEPSPRGQLNSESPRSNDNPFADYSSKSAESDKQPKLTKRGRKESSPTPGSNEDTGNPFATPRDSPQPEPKTNGSSKEGASSSLGADAKSSEGSDGVESPRMSATLKKMNEQSEKREKKISELLTRLDKSEHEAQAERERAAQLRNDLERTSATLKKEIRDLQKQLETFQKVDQKTKSPMRIPSIGGSDDNQNDLMRNVSMLRQEQELTGLKEKITFYEAMEERRVKLQTLVSAPAFDLDSQGRSVSALQLAQYLYSSKSLDTEKQFDDVNVRFLADIPRALVQSYARFEADLGYLAFYLNWTITLLEAILPPNAATVFEPRKHGLTIAFESIKKAKEWAKSLAAVTLKTKAPEVLSPRGRARSFEAPPQRVEEHLAPTRKLFLDLDRSASHLLALIADYFLVKSQSMNLPTLFIEAPPSSPQGAPKRGAANEQSFHDVAKLLSEGLNALVARLLPSPLILQIMAQAFYGMNAMVFNALADYPQLTATLAYSLKMAVSKVEEWATKSALSKELVPLARDSFDHVVSTANVLLIDKAIFAGDFDYSSLFPALNIRQLDLVLTKFVTDEFAPKPVPINVTSKVKAELARVDSNRVSIEIDPYRFVTK